MTIEDIKANTILGEDKKRWLTANFELTPVSHTTLMRNQERTCVCGRKIKGPFHVFIAKKRETVDKVFFNAGPECSKTLIEFAKIDALPLVNIILNVNESIIKGASTGGHRNLNSRIEFSNFNSELMKAIGLYCASRDWYPYSIGTISHFTVNKPLKDNHQGAEWFNDRLIKDETRISQILAELAEENEIRDFRFPVLNQFLIEKVKDCRIDI